jgi:chromosome segregation ATPase
LYGGEIVEPPTDLEIARQLDMLWQKIGEGITKANVILNKAKEIETEISQAEPVKLEIAALIQKSQGQIEQMEKISPKLNKLYQQIVLAIENIGGQEALELLQKEIQDARTGLSEAITQLQQAEDKLQNFESELQERSDSLSELAFQITQDKAGISYLIAQVEAKVNNVLQVQLQLQEFLQNTVSTLEHLHSEVTSIAQQVQADRAAIQSLNLTDANRINNLEKLVQQQQEEIKRLNQQLLESQSELGQRLQSMVQNQQYLRNWLLGVTFGVAFLVAIAIAMGGWR